MKEFSLLCQLPAPSILISLTLPCFHVLLQMCLWRHCILAINMLDAKRALVFSVSAVFLGATIYTSLTLHASLGLHHVSPGPLHSHSQDALTPWYQPAGRTSFSQDCQPVSAPVISFQVVLDICGCLSPALKHCTVVQQQK